MKVNPDKFQEIAIGKNTQSKNISFNLNGNIIKTEDEVKLLGVTIDYELIFNSHITNICRKASRQLNVLKRIGKYLNRLGKLTIYHSFILSNFNYCPVIWHFCSEANTKKMEKIQERALKFIYNENHSTYEKLLAKSKLPSLKIRRIRTIAIETFKIINKETPQYLHDLVTLKNNNIILGTAIQHIYQQSRLPGIDWTLLDTMLQKLGISCQTISGKKHLSINLRV